MVLFFSGSASSWCIHIAQPRENCRPMEANFQNSSVVKAGDTQMSGVISSPPKSSSAMYTGSSVRRGCEIDSDESHFDFASFSEALGLMEDEAPKQTQQIPIPAKKAVRKKKNVSSLSEAVRNQKRSLTCAKHKLQKLSHKLKDLENKRDSLKAVTDVEKLIVDDINHHIGSLKSEYKSVEADIANKKSKLRELEGAYHLAKKLRQQV